MIERLYTWGAAVQVDGWMVQLFAVVFAVALAALAQRLIFARLHARAQRSANVWDDTVIEALRAPLAGLIWVVGLSLAGELVARATQAPVFAVVPIIRSVAVVALLAWFLVKLIRGMERQAADPAVPFGSNLDDTTINAIGKLLRATVIITASLIGLQALGLSVSGVLAFGGVGGIAVGFAARDLLANFFGGLMVYLDRPFRQGEWIRSPDREIEGTVEHIGWRLTRIRTFDLRALYVPNAVFNQVAIENPSRMLNRRIHETVGVRYDDVAAVPVIVRDVDAMLREHPDIAHDRTLMVYFNAFGPSSLDFFVYCFTRTRVWAEYHAVKQDVLLRIARIVADHGAEVAFPTTTVHLHQASVPELPEPEPERTGPTQPRLA